jgi:hypothetical protein
MIKYAFPILLLAIQVSTRIFDFSTWPFIQYNMFTTSLQNEPDFFFFSVAEGDKEIPLIEFRNTYPVLPFMMNRMVKRKIEERNQAALDEMAEVFRRRAQKRYHFKDPKISVYRTSSLTELMFGTPKTELVYEQKF